MRKKDYRDAKVSKRMVSKSEGVGRTYDVIQYAYADCEALFEENYYK